ncbi:LLM class flavin-dependent oxidoreductase [Rhabdothermincola salaria]|uniref:LLM class flavin-dependent oxidoreductase n=1 Tax=Rhabdothermincola salaria TaxID=2903142 RepID=UPI001E4C4954|nr:LLM class flavin-dependent oxidoreductase [Rhabdothermincola salaria]MCD9623947.1 LLM class flavin-dependent oxidoreductase [Rhabdothermincola salaria]
MFRSWVFTEMPYPHIPPEDTFDSVRVSFPSRHYDPEVGHQLYQAYYDMYAAADELGLDIMCNEHHATATCVEPAVPLSLAILARETTRARLLALGNPVANRSDPVRVAEEMAMIDVISQGRLEVGFVRGVPQELSAGNVSPVDQKPRFREAIDLILEAWQAHDGPINWEGEHFHHRQVNVWPRVYQDPHPPVWIPTQSTSTAVETAERGFTVATILNGVAGCRSIFDAYRTRAAECGTDDPPLEKFAYLGLVAVGETDEEGYAIARKLQWYIQHNKVAPQFMDVPGYIEPKVRAAMLQSQLKGEEVTSPIAHLAHAPVEELTEDGYFFAGSPDTVFHQMRRFYEKVGGFGNFLMMVQGGTMGLELATRTMELYSREVMPRFRREVYGSAGPSAAAGPAGVSGLSADREDGAPLGPAAAGDEPAPR